MHTTHSSTGTAADYLTYQKYTDPHGQEALTRVATSSEEWIFGDWDAEKYTIKFDKNFSKKHLFTFSKTTENDGDDNKKHQSLYHKIESVLNVRSNIQICKKCRHPRNKHQTGSGAPTACKVDLPPVLPALVATKCGCTPYEEMGGADVHAYFRWKAGKPAHETERHNVLGGAATTKNTCIVLNYVPKTEFEAVVVASIRAHEKPPGWKRGDNLAVPVPAVGPKVQKELVWDFGEARRGVIVDAELGKDPGTWTKHRRCTVKAEKIATAVGWQTWRIFHFEHSG